MVMPSDSNRKEPSSPEAIQKALTSGVPLGRWKEGLMFDGISPTPGLKSASNWFPRTEAVGPDEIRIIFMGTSPSLRPGQMNTSILVQLGNGDNFVFDIGEGAIANYVAADMSLNELDKIFITHLHVDHFGSLPYLYMFGGWAGRWHKPLRVFGPSGRDPEYGTEAMIEGMKKMLGWHKDAFSIFAVGKAWDIEVNEFDFRDNGGVIYDEDGVEVIHWQRSHAKDGASGYRLNWNGLSVVWTGDGRPNDLDEKYASGADVYITEAQPEVIAISSGVQGVPPFVGRFTVDMHHTPAYAAGYLANRIQPRLLMTTHMPFDTYLNEETVAEIRPHGKAPTTSEHQTASWSTSPKRTSGFVRGSSRTIPTTRPLSSISTTSSLSSRLPITVEKTFKSPSYGTTRFRRRCITRRATTPNCSKDGLSMAN